MRLRDHLQHHRTCGADGHMRCRRTRGNNVHGLCGALAITRRQHSKDRRTEGETGQSRFQAARSASADSRYPGAAIAPTAVASGNEACVTAAWIDVANARTCVAGILLTTVAIACAAASGREFG